MQTKNLTHKVTVKTALNGEQICEHPRQEFRTLKVVRVSVPEHGALQQAIDTTLARC